MVRWLPLESNPDVMNKFMSGLGVPGSAQVCDVFGLEAELLAMVPKPVYALMLLYPLTSKSEEFKAQQEAGIASAGQDMSTNLFYMKQFVGNACGTVALMHAVGNNTDEIELEDGPLKSFLEKTADMTPEERGHALEEDDSISAVHEDCAAEGQTEAPDREKKMDTHFIAFVNVDGNLYELDGRKKFPINHGPTSQENFLIDGASVLRDFMDRDTGEARFAVLALTAASA